MSDAGAVENLEIEWDSFVNKFAVDTEQAKQRIRKVSEELHCYESTILDDRRSIFSLRKMWCALFCTILSRPKSVNS